MQAQQKQLYIKNIKPINLKGAKKQVSISENESQYELPQKNVQAYIPYFYSALKKNKRVEGYKLHWTLQENILYKKFLEQNINLFEADFRHRMVSKINVLMSECIKTKTFKQCRSHHQKMMIYNKSVAGILKFIQDLQNEHSPIKIKLRKSEERLQRPIENVPVQQMNEEVVEGEGVEIVQTQPKIQQSQHVPIFTLNDIFERRIEVNLLNSDHYNIQEYFQPNVWWDGYEI